MDFTFAADYFGLSSGGLGTNNLPRKKSTQSSIERAVAKTGRPAGFGAVGFGVVSAIS
jgi:hypothetical protein